MNVMLIKVPVLASAFIKVFCRLRPTKIWCAVSAGFVLLLATYCPPTLARTVNTLPEHARIISIGGAITEIIFALNAEDTLIARDTTSRYPLEASKLPNVGYMRALSPEGILSLEPDGILLVEGSGPQPTIEILENAAVPMVIIPDHFTRDGVSEKIIKVGEAIHHEERASRLVDGIKKDFAENDKLIAEVSQPKRVLFVMTVQNGRVMAAGKKTAADGMITLSGGINAIDSYDGYKLVTDEAIINAAPDFILMMNHAGSTITTDDVLAVPAIQLTPAGKSKSIVQMDGLYLLGFGPRTPQASREVIKALYGK